MSQTPAGWYPSKTNPGMARYWDGQSWTDQYRPLPDDEEAPPTNYSQVGPSSSQPTQQDSVWSPERIMDTVKTFNGGQGNRAQGSAWTPDKIVESVKGAALNKENQAIGTQAAGGALIADGIVGFGEKRPSIFAAFSSIGFGIVWLLMCNFILSPITASNEVKTGEVKISAEVSDVRWNTPSRSSNSSPGCSPIASFVVDGRTYTARSNGYISPCSWDIGDKVDVIYNPKQIEGSSRVDDSASFGFFTKVFPAIGVFIIISGIWTFIKRAGSIGAGIYLLRHGRKKYDELKAEQARQAQK